MASVNVNLTTFGENIAVYTATTGAQTIKLGKQAKHTVTEIVLSGTYGTLTFSWQATVDGTNYFDVFAVSRSSGVPIAGGTTIAPVDNSTVSYLFDSRDWVGIQANIAGLSTVTTLTFTPFSQSVVGAAILYSSSSGGTFSGVQSFAAGITFTGATAVNLVKFPDNLADAMSIQEGTSKYITFVSTNSAERVLYTVAPSLLDNVGLMIGTGEDIVLAWDATRLNVTQAATNSEIRWGVDGAGIDQRWYGDTASAYCLWDQSADQLILGGVATMSGLRVGTSGATAITTTRAVTKADSGGIFTVSQAAAYTVTCATPGGAGERYQFQLVAPGANDVSIVATGCTFEGSITIDAATIVATGSTLKFASGASLLGDNIELVSTSATKFFVRAIASGAGGITIT